MFFRFSLVGSSFAAPFLRLVARGDGVRGGAYLGGVIFLCTGGLRELLGRWDA
jgi:hypothetical protein